MGKQEPAPQERGKWGNPAEFILACLGYAVGLGNVWRFPYMCFENGGGAFLIPYAVMLTFVGLPIFFIELILGQYTGSGPVHAWEAAPLFQGIGFGMLVISFISCVYYNMVIAWAMYYMFASWQSVLPWQGCQNDYNTAHCYSKREATFCESFNGTWFNQTCYNTTYLQQFEDLGEGTFCNSSKVNDQDVQSCWNYTYNPQEAWLLNETLQRVSPSEEYFSFAMLGRSETINDTGPLKWDLVLCLLLAWIVCYLCVIKGIKSAGKVVYFTATFPYLILIILVIRGAMLDGALEGIKFYIIPDFTRLADSKVWVDAAGQIFFSLSVGMGGLLTFASYNKFHNNVYRDTMIVAIGNCLTSFFAGFAIFSILGYLAKVLDKKVSQVARSGSGLAFIAYPEVVTWLEPPQLWSTLFFFMLLTLGLDSQFAGVENLMTAIVDVKPQLRGYKPVISLLLCVVMFLVGLPMCARSGTYWLDLMGYYSSGWSLVLIALCEVMVAAWVIGAKKIMEMVHEMVGFRLHMHWWVCWSIISPLLLIAILIFNMIDFTPLSYGDYVLEPWAQGIGWLMALSSVAMIPIVAVYRICHSYKDPDFDGLGLGQRIVKLTKPSKNWKTSVEKEEEARAAMDRPITSINGKADPPEFDNIAYQPNAKDESTTF